MLLASSDSNKIALKLHRQFGHPGAERLIRMLRNADMLDNDIEKQIRSVTENYEMCIKYKRPAARPVVSVQMSEKFNEVIAMDLKQVQQHLVLVMVDLATRYCVASVIPNKSAKTMVGGIFRNWISLFGAPRKFLSDNGLEFNNSDMRELGDLFGVKILATLRKVHGVMAYVNG